MEKTQEFSVQIFQGSGFQRGAVHATNVSLLATPGFHAGGVYTTTHDDR